MISLNLTPVEIEALLISIKVALWATVAEMPLALGAAWVIARHNFWGKDIFNAIIHLPLVLPPVVVGYVLLVTLGRNGLVGSFIFDTFGISLAFNWKGAAIAAGVMAFPLMVRAMRFALEAVDIRLENAALTLGAPRLKVFTTITLPLMLPGIVAGFVLAFARALGEFGATITFVSNIPGQTQTLPLALYTLIQAPDGEGGAMRLVVILLAVAFVALIASEIMSRTVQRRIKGGGQ